MNKYLLGLATFALASGCGPGYAGELDGEDQVGSDESGSDEIGITEAGLGEATCGTASVNSTVTFKKSAVLLRRAAPYGSTACTNADLIGLTSDVPKAATVSAFQTNSRLSKEECAKTTFRAAYFKNGTKVIDLTRTGQLRFSNCQASITFSFNPARTETTVRDSSANVTTVLLAGGTPVAADNARFALQAIKTLPDGGTAINKYDFRIDP